MLWNQKGFAVLSIAVIEGRNVPIFHEFRLVKRPRSSLLCSQCNVFTSGHCGEDDCPMED